MADNKQLKSFAPTVHCTRPFCIALCSMHLISLAAIKHDLALERDNDGECGESFYTRRQRILGRYWNYT